MSIKTQEEISIRHNLSYFTIISFHSIMSKLELYLSWLASYKQKRKVHLNEIMEWTDDLA